MADARDRWHRWLLDVRHGGDPGYRDQVLRALHAVRDEILDRARLRPDDTVLDVGTGDGLIAFGALDRLGPGGRVIFSDISAGLLDHCRDAATTGGELARCEFVQAPADRLDGIARASVDVVTTRSVLIYVQDKAAAFAEFRRVLRPGGRVSSYEPINILMHPCDSRRLSGFDLSPLPEIAAKIGAAFDAAEQPHAGPMLDFDDRDLVRLAEQAGFTEVSMDLRVTVRPSRAPLEWDSFLRSSGNPYLPPLGEMLARALTRAEFTALTAYLRPLVEAGHGERRLAVAYLTAREAG